MANIPVGLIGCGGRGRGHVRALHELADVELVAVCDPVAVSREQVGDEWGVERRYADVEAMLDAEELAAAIVATPAHLNAEAALPCLERGVDTLLEKPPGMSLDQTRALKEAAEASGARGMVGWNRRFDPLVLQVREEIESRGPIYQLVGEFHKSMSGFIAGGRFPEIVMDNMLLESPIHAIDLVRHLGGSPVAEVHSFVRRASAYKDVHAALVVFENDCVAQICANYTTDARLDLHHRRPPRALRNPRPRHLGLYRGDFHLRVGLRRGAQALAKGGYGQHPSPSRSLFRLHQGRSSHRPTGCGLGRGHRYYGACYGYLGGPARRLLIAPQDTSAMAVANRTASTVKLQAIS